MKSKLRWVFWRVVHTILDILEVVLKCIFYPLATIVAFLGYTSIIWIPLLLIGLLMYESRPTDHGPYYKVGSGLASTYYLKSEVVCEVEKIKTQYEVSCLNLENNSRFSFFTDYYEEGEHIFY